MYHKMKGLNMKNDFNFAKTIVMNSAVLPHFRKTDSIMYLPMMKPLRNKMRSLNLFDTAENLFEAFTLAETLITLTILGVVAAITIPALINKYNESANRTKLKKAMAAYEKALNQMIIDNDIKGTITAVEGFKIGQCDISSSYFKTVEILKNDKCRFKTADKVWWDITDIEHPVIAFNEADLDNADAEKRFVLVGHLENGVLRINDKGFETTDPNKTYLSKLYSFINKDGINSNLSEGGSEEDLEDEDSYDWKEEYANFEDYLKTECSSTIKTKCYKRIDNHSDENTDYSIMIYVYDSKGTELVEREFMYDKSDTDGISSFNTTALTKDDFGEIPKYIYSDNGKEHITLSADEKSCNSITASNSTFNCSTYKTWDDCSCESDDISDPTSVYICSCSDN